MSEWNPSIVVIEKVEKHPNADKLDIATVLGDYPVIIGRDTYKVGDLATYICVDTVLPDIEEYHHLTPRAFEQYEETLPDGKTIIKNRPTGPRYSIGSCPERHRTIFAKRIRNIFSMGLLLPPVAGLAVGDSVIEALNLTKMVEEEEDNIEPGKKKKMGANAEKAPSGWSVPHYDLEAARKYASCFIEGEEVVVKEKIHGSNFSASHDGERLWVKSRNFYKKEDPMDAWWDAALRLNLKEKLAKYPGLVFFGELTGQVKGFKYDAIIENGALLTKVHFFDVYDSRINRYLDVDAAETILKDLDLPIVPELYRGPWTTKEHMYSFAEGKSTLNDKHVREGIVVRPVINRFEPKVGGRLVLKFIGEGYSLQK